MPKSSNVKKKDISRRKESAAPQGPSSKEISDPDRVQVCIRLLEKEIRHEGTVCWVRDLGDGQYTFGVHFDKLGRGEREYLRAYASEGNRVFDKAQRDEGDRVLNELAAEAEKEAESLGWVSASEIEELANH